MSTTDLAFIKAYYQDEQPPTPAQTVSDTSVPKAPSTAHRALPPEVRVDSPTPSPETLPAIDEPQVTMPPGVTAAPAASQEPPAEKRPLSSFGEPAQPPDTTFRPQRFVDHFVWPNRCLDLEQCYSPALAAISERLLAAGEEGRSLVGLASHFSGEGVSTVLFCLARALTARGATVAVVDGDFQHASLAPLLQLEIGAGWDDFLRGDVLLADVVIQSHDDQLALLPIRSPESGGRALINSLQTSVTAGVLRNAYDFVMFDLGALCGEDNLATATRLIELARIDVTMFVADPARTPPDALDVVVPDLIASGTEIAGIIENFADEGTRAKTVDLRHRPVPAASCDFDPSGMDCMSGGFPR